MKKKIVALMFCEILVAWSPMILSVWYHGVYAGIIWNLVNWIYTGLVFLSFLSVILSLIILIIFRKSDNKIFIKHWFTYSLASVIATIIAIIILSAESHTDIGVYAPGF